MNYKSGDIVKIKLWKEMVAQYGLDEDGDIACSGCFTKDMEYLCGHDVVISKVYEVEGKRPLNVYLVDGIDKFFFDDMFSNFK